MVTKKQLAKQAAEEKVKAFEKELKSSVGTAITAAFGFLLALTWRDLIVEFVEKISGEIAFGGQVISTLIVTVICVLGIMISAKLLVPKDSEK